LVRRPTTAATNNGGNQQRLETMARMAVRDATSRKETLLGRPILPTNPQIKIPQYKLRDFLS